MPCFFIRNLQYEGEEQSLNVFFYTAASPNQQLVPAAEYMAKEMGCKKFYLQQIIFSSHGK